MHGAARRCSIVLEWQLSVPAGLCLPSAGARRLEAPLHNASVAAQYAERLRPIGARGPHHRAPAGVPAQDMQGNLMVFFPIKVTERTGRFEKG